MSRKTELSVIYHRRKYATHWRDKPDSYWYARLMEEVAELGMALEGKHKDLPEHELKQISSICINWLEKRETLKSEDEDESKRDKADIS